LSSPCERRAPSWIHKGFSQSELFQASWPIARPVTGQLSKWRCARLMHLALLEGDSTISGSRPPIAALAQAGQHPKVCGPIISQGAHI